MPVTLQFTYARSGGTLLARCLAALPGTMVFSEVNPRRRPRRAGRPVTLAEQARAWYGIELPGGDFAADVALLADHCGKTSRHLVLRDWSIIDFVPMVENDGRPVGSFSLRDALADRDDVRGFGFVRDAIDVWISNGCRTDFFVHYRAFLERLLASGMPVFRYEDLCRDPDGTVRRICAHTGLPFDPSYRDFARVTKVTGDVDLAGGSRGGRLNRIVNLPRARIPAERIRWLEANADARAVNEMAGYPVAYASRPLEHALLALAGRWRSRLLGRRERSP